MSRRIHHFLICVCVCVSANFGKNEGVLFTQKKIFFKENVEARRKKATIFLLFDIK